MHSSVFHLFLPVQRRSPISLDFAVSLLGSASSNSGKEPFSRASAYTHLNSRTLLLPVSNMPRFFSLRLTKVCAQLNVDQFLEYLNFNFIFQALIQLYISSKCFLNGPFSFSFSFNFVFSIQLIVNVQYKFEPWTSGVGSNRSIS